MKTFGTLLGIILAAALVLAVGGGLLALLAYGIGWLLNLVMGLDAFQAAALSLAGLYVFIFLAERIFNMLTSWKPRRFDDDEEYDDEFDDEFDEYDDEFDDEFDEYDDDIDDDEAAENMARSDERYAGIPRWRRPTKELDFTNTKPNDRCPCGSGRKYKNCHGIKQAKK